MYVSYFQGICLSFWACRLASILEMPLGILGQTVRSFVAFGNVDILWIFIYGYMIIYGYIVVIYLFCGYLFLLGAVSKVGRRMKTALCCRMELCLTHLQ